MGVAHHTHYVVWFELGRTELMRDLGCTYRDLEERDGILFPVTELGARFIASARDDEAVTIRTRLVRVGGARVRFEYEIASEDDGKLLATGFTEHGAVGRDGRPRRLPADLRDRLASGEDVR